MATHAHTLIEHDGQRAEVDVGIAPLVLALWRAGYVTSSSCEAFAPAGGLAYVAFSPEHAEQAEAFRRIVGPEAQVVVTTAEDVAAAEGQRGEIYPVGTVGIGFAQSRIESISRQIAQDP